jgi:hypothetical protein
VRRQIEMNPTEFAQRFQALMESQSAPILAYRLQHNSNGRNHIEVLTDRPGLDRLAEKYSVPAYTKQSLELTKSYIESIFGKDTEKQQSIDKWF